VGIVGGDGQERGDGILPLERRLARTHPVYHAAEAEQVRTGIDLPAAGLLGGHVRRRADDGPLPCQRFRLVGGPGQAEIEDFHPAARGLQPDVGRFNIAVDQAGRVRCRQPFGRFPRDPQHLGGGWLRLLAHSRVEGLPFQVFHRQEGDAAVFADLVDGDNVIVLDRGGGAGLAGEAFACRFADAQAGLHRFHGNEAAQRRILGLEDDTHAAGAEDLLDAVRAEPADFVGGLRRGQ
jgi:hypothetical protein